ncbi:uncharacterized protein [Pagrus major]|uniref:uncharacterized protein n=1 Tax=Pagrus major TaxID=143350 RepID=UPI003CC85F32
MPQRAGGALFQDHALLVPFQDRGDGRGLLSTLRGVVDHLAGILGKSFRDSKGVGRYDPSWNSFQAELALEELFFGHPLSPLNNTLVVGSYWGNLYKQNEQLPCTSLRSDKPPGRLTGGVNVKQLATKDSFPVPHTFGRARTLLRDAGQDVEECLVQGFTAEGIIFFPAFKFTDLRSTRRIWWNFKDWIQVSHGDQPLLQISDVASKTLQVFSEIQRHSLCFSKHLETYREHGMPWMAMALQRLPKETTGGLLLNTLTFISCVALIENGAYIDFVHLKELLQQMSLGGMSQARLQQLLILGKFTLDKVRNVRIWSLHPTVSYKLQKQVTTIPSLRPAPSEEKECPTPGRCRSCR